MTFRSDARAFGPAPNRSDLPPGWFTDLAISELAGAIVEEHNDYIVLRSPNNPDYHWGNCILVTDPRSVNDANRWIARFHEVHPGADWISIGLTAFPTDTAGWDVANVELEQLDVLTSHTLPHSAPLPAGYTSRQLIPADWDWILARELAENDLTGYYEPARYERFIRDCHSEQQALCARGAAAWFGAFDGEKLVSDLGIVRCGTTARYQAVGTHPDHRRRGLASHLLGEAAQWAASNGCDHWVILTEATNDAGRVYRRAGLAPDIASVNAYRRPPLNPSE